jgi:hypothetical protein
VLRGRCEGGGESGESGGELKAEETTSVCAFGSPLSDVLGAGSTGFGGASFLEISSKLLFFPEFWTAFAETGDVEAAGFESECSVALAR